MLAARSAERNDDLKDVEVRKLNNCSQERCKEFAVKAQARFIELVFSDKTKVIAT